MIIYTAIPLEQVFSEDNTSEYEIFEMDYQGKKIIAEPINHHQARVVQLISSNPNDYLNPNLAPGKIIFFRPE